MRQSRAWFSGSVASLSHALVGELHHRYVRIRIFGTHRRRSPYSLLLLSPRIGVSNIRRAARCGFDQIALH